MGVQVEDCHRLAAELGWEVAEDYIDNDVSAYSGKKRPAYERMLEDLRDGHRDAVVVYHVDRLTRRPLELEQFVEVVAAAKVRHVRFVAGGELDVANGDGLMVMRMLGVMAASESATKSRRMLRKMEEKAAAGLPHGGANRPFGFADDKITHRPEEVAVVRDMVARYIAGESINSLARWLDDEGIRTIAGETWRATSGRTMLKNGRLAGLRLHRGEVIGKAVWDPIISEEDWHKVLARMAEAATTRRRTPRRYLLSGLLRCGKCGNKLFSSPRKTARRYVCMPGPDHGGCGHLTVVAPPVEELITDAVLYRLDTGELAAALTGQANADVQAAALSDALAGDRAQLDELAALYADKAISVREWMNARRPIEARIDDAQRRLGRFTGSHAISGLVGNGIELRAAWATLNLTRQAAIVAAVLDHAIIGPGVQGARTLDPGRVDPIWRL